MKKLKLFLENFIVYGLGGIINKIIPIIMVPVITRIMPGTTYYGLSDLSNTIVSFGCAIAILGMYDAMYRLFFDKDETEFKKSVCSTSLLFTIIMSIVVFSIMILCRNIIAKYFFGGNEYSYLVWLSAIAVLVGATDKIVAAPTRMQNKKVLYLSINAISPLISYGIAIVLLLKGYYVIALPLAAIISGLANELIFLLLNKKWFSLKNIDIKKLKPLLIIAVPLFPNFLIYWLFNSSDKIMITNLIGVGAAGIYSVGSKLGHCSQLIYTAFTGGWQYFAFSTMKEKNQVESNSKVFEYLGSVSFVATTFICALSYPLFNVLFAAQYLEGYIVAPYLFLAPLLQMLFQVACNQFIVIKKTWPNMLILLTGAIVNILLNLILIPRLGIEGASIASLIGYIISDIICVIVLKKMKLMVISTRFVIVTFLMICYIILWRVFVSKSVLISLLMAFAYMIIVITLHGNELRLIYNQLFRKKVGK